MKRPTLTAPFANTKELSKGGSKFTYIPAAELVDRLNAVLGVGEWGFQVLEAFRDGDWIVAHGRLNACGNTFEQYGGQLIKNYNTGDRKGQPVDLGDDYKGAASDALKKCAQMIGCGLYLPLGRSPLSAQLDAGVGEVTSPNGKEAAKGVGTDDLTGTAARVGEGQSADPSLAYAADDPGRPY